MGKAHHTGPSSHPKSPLVNQTELGSIRVVVKGVSQSAKGWMQREHG